MEILAEVYRYDQRKAYHAITFADQALQYRARYGNSRAYDYLDTAREWLENQMKAEPWNRKLKQKLADVNEQL